MPTKRAKTLPLDALPGDELEALVTRVRAERAVLRKSAFPQVLSARGQATLREALARRAVDAGKRYFRVALVDQVGLVLEHQPAIPLNGLKTCLRGLEAASEVKELVGELLRAKRARLVLLDGRPALVSWSTPVVGPPALAQVLEASDALARLVRAGKTAAKKSPPLSVVVSEVLSLIKTIERALGGTSAETAVLTQLAQLTSPAQPIVSVPSLIAALGDQLAPDAIAPMLLEAHRAGLVELRPESGVQLLTPAQAALCPKGPTGVPLSYVRLLSTTRLGRA